MVLKCVANLVSRDLQRSLIPFRRQTLVWNHGTVYKMEGGKGIDTSNRCLFVEVAIFLLLVYSILFRIVVHLYLK